MTTRRRARKQTGTKRPADDTVFMKPEGGPDGHRRTPKNIGDQYKGRASYIPEMVLATMVVARKNRYHIKWTGLPAGANTWEPEEHLNGDEGKKVIANFKAKCAAEILEVISPFTYSLLRSHWLRFFVAVARFRLRCFAEAPVQSAVAIS